MEGRLWGFRVAEHCSWRLPPRLRLLAGRCLPILTRRAWCGSLLVFLPVAERIWRRASSPMLCQSFGTGRSSSRTGQEPEPGLHSTPWRTRPPTATPCCSLRIAFGSAAVIFHADFRSRSRPGAVSLVGTYPNIIVVPNSSPFQKLEELIAHAKANPGTMSWGSPGIGSVPHLAGELFKHRAGIEIAHVPYRGANQGLMSDFLAGRLDLMFNTTGSLLEPVRSKQVRGLAVTSATRFPDEPELPTAAESGVPGYDASSWYAIYVPAKTPTDIIAKVNADMAAVLNDTAIKDKFKLLGVLPRGSTPQELAAMNVADAALWGPIIKEANIKVE